NGPRPGTELDPAYGPSSATAFAGKPGAGAEGKPIVFGHSTSAPGSGSLRRPRPGQQRAGVVAADFTKIGLVKYLAQAVDVIGAAAERKIRPEHDLRDRYHLGQRGHWSRMGDRGGVVVETAQQRRDAFGGLRGGILAGQRQADETLDQERHRAAAMGEDKFDVRAARSRAGEEQACDRARGVGAKLDNRRRQLGDQVAAAVRRRRMYEEDRLAPVELVHHRGEYGIAEPFV